MSTLSRFQSDCWQPISSIGLPTVGYPSIQGCLMSCSLGIPRFFGQSHLQRRNFTTWALWRHHGSNLRRCGQAFRCSCLVQSWAANRRWINKCVAKVVQSSSKVQNESALVSLVLTVLETVQDILKNLKKRSWITMCMALHAEANLWFWTQGVVVAEPRGRLFQQIH
jgi:hypothetical protein